MQKIIECVPNFSEGRDLEVIRQITAAIESVEGVSLLNVDPGATTNRTVVTFAGNVRNHSRGRRVEYLEYDAYVPMAERKLRAQARVEVQMQVRGQPAAAG